MEVFYTNFVIIIIWYKAMFQIFILVLIVTTIITFCNSVLGHNRRIDPVETKDVLLNAGKILGQIALIVFLQWLISLPIPQL